MRTMCLNRRSNGPCSPTVPTNDWLIRAGRLSLGGLLNQQNLDVGVTYDMARLPNEVYLISSSYDFDGLSIAKTWSTTGYEITLDGTFGMQNRDYRVYNNASGKSDYYSGDITGGGLVLTVTDYDQTMYRLGWSIHELDIRRRWNSYDNQFYTARQRLIYPRKT